MGGEGGAKNAKVFHKNVKIAEDGLARFPKAKKFPHGQLKNAYTYGGFRGWVSGYFSARQKPSKSLIPMVVFVGGYLGISQCFSGGTT